MTSKRLFYVMCGLLVLIFGLGVGGVYVGSKSLQQKALKLTSLKAESYILDKQQRTLTQAKRDIVKYEELEKVAKTIVPQEKDQARTVREIVKLAEDTGISISNISFPSSTLGQAPAKVTTPSTGGSTPATPGATASPATPSTAAPTATQVKPVEGIPGVYKLEVTVQSDNGKPVPYFKFIEFLRRLEQNRRTSQVSSLTVQPTTNDRQKVTFNLIINVYIKP